MVTPKLNQIPRESQLSCTGLPRGTKTLTILEHDLPNDCYLDCYDNSIAIDLEFKNLDFRENKILLIQIADKEGNVFLIRRPNDKSKNLIEALRNPNKKIFHCAVTDLSFILAHLGIEILDNQFECTKILMKILHPKKRAGLAPTLQEICNITIEKKYEWCDWNTRILSKEQIIYAINDIIYLHELIDKLKFENTNQIEIYSRVQKAINHQVYLNVSGYADTLKFDKDDGNEVVNNRHWWKERNKDVR